MRKFILFLLFGFALLLLNFKSAAETNTAGVVATIIGPNESTPKTEISQSGATDTNKVFWLTIKVMDVETNSLTALKGQTIKVPTTSFGKKMLGQTVPLYLVHLENPGRFGEHCHFHCTDFWSAYHEGLSWGKSRVLTNH